MLSSNVIAAHFPMRHRDDSFAWFQLCNIGPDGPKVGSLVTKGDAEGSFSECAKPSALFI
jgi:hypothetical protein